MSARTPKVSVLIPTYNYARYLPEAIESVLNQTFTDFELLISDDASTDDSEQIIRSYAARDERIRFRIQRPNLGMVNNWNWCLHEARGEYIKFVFGDDFLARQDSLDVLVRMIDDRSDVVMASSARTVVDEQSKSVALWEHIGCSGVFDGKEAISWSLRTNGNVFGEPSVVLFKKANALRGFDSTYAQVVDWELWIHLLEQGHLAYTTEPLCSFRQHSLQQTERNRQAHGTANEHPRLIRQYAHHLVRNPAASKEIFDSTIHLRKLKKPTVEDLEFAQILEEALGPSYVSFWIRYKLTRPVHNLRRFWIKHVRGLPVTARRAAPATLKPLPY